MLSCNEDCFANKKNSIYVIDIINFYKTHVHFYQLKRYNVDADLDVSDNVISVNEHSSEMLTSQSKDRN